RQLHRTGCNPLIRAISAERRPSVAAPDLYRHRIQARFLCSAVEPDDSAVAPRQHAPRVRLPGIEGNSLGRLHARERSCARRGPVASHTADQPSAFPALGRLAEDHAERGQLELPGCLCQGREAAVAWTFFFGALYVLKG